MAFFRTASHRGILPADRGRHGLGLDTPGGWEEDVSTWINSMEL